MCIQYHENFHRVKLRLASVLNKEEGTNPDSHVNYRYLDTPATLKRLKNLHFLVRKQNKHTVSYTVMGTHKLTFQQHLNVQSPGLA